MMTCSECRFYYTESRYNWEDKEEVGLCGRFPKQHTGWGHGESTWEHPPADDVCGEYKEKEDD